MILKRYLLEATNETGEEKGGIPIAMGEVACI